MTVDHDRRSLKGRLVVAAPSLVDDNFDGTVVLMLEHGLDGAVGVVLNRPTDIAAADVLPIHSLPLADPPTVFLGGPVGREEAVGLARVAEGVRLVHLGMAVEGESAPGEPGGTGEPGEADDVAAVEQIRVFVGHAGWGPGQLESELAAGAWFVVDADVADPFTAQPATLWREVLTRQGGVFTTVPPDPSMN
jgi:putative transcriptional regulator